MTTNNNVPVANAVKKALLSLAAMAAAIAGPAIAKDMVIHAGTLIDGVAASPKSKVSIVIKDERIVSVQNGFVTPAGAEVIDLSSATVLPGFIEAHDHISAGQDRRPMNRFTQTEGDAVIAGMLNARREVELGFTTVRDCGSGPLTAPALIRAIDAGRIVGPRLWTALQPLGPTGGHSDRANGLRPDIFRRA
jgi:imidazolonepropionase-like amidohydrolase